MSVRSVGNVDLAVGLVNCPVKMVGVADNHDHKGSMYHHHPVEDGAGDYAKVKMPKVCDGCAEVVPNAEISKGFEYNGEIIMLSHDEMEAVAASTGAALEVGHFVKAAEVDPMLFADQNVYRLVPDTKRGRQATTIYLTVKEVLTEKGLAGVVQYTRWGRSRQALLDVEPSDDGGVLVLRNMMWPDELRGTDGLLPSGGAEVDPRLVPVMESVVDSMTTEWVPANYTDAYRERLSAAIEAKAAGDEIAKVESAGSSAIDDVSDLLAKLEMSIQKKQEDAA